MTHTCVGNLTIIGSDNGLSPSRCQAITWTNVWILLIRPLGTNFSEIFIEINKFSFKKIHLKTSFRKWRPFCLGLNVNHKMWYSWTFYFLYMRWVLQIMLSISLTNFIIVAWLKMWACNDGLHSVFDRGLCHSNIRIEECGVCSMFSQLLISPWIIPSTIL